MEALALILIALGGLGIRQVARGRAPYVAQDVSDAVASLSRGDFDGVSEALSRDSEDVFTAASETIGKSVGTVTAPNGNRAGSLLAECQRLGKEANFRYVWGATGPSSYDCSGLVWRALKNLGWYSGPRFTTATFERDCSAFIDAVETPSVNDIILWKSGHIGVYAGDGKCFAAKSARTGIGFQSATEPIRGRRPLYYRWKVSTSLGYTRPTSARSL